PKESESESQVSSSRSRKRSAAPRKRAKKKRSGSPRCVTPSGTGKLNEKAEKTLSWLVTMFFVGPRQTEYASTHGITNATRTTHESSSNSQRNAQARNVI